MVQIALWYSLMEVLSSVYNYISRNSHAGSVCLIDSTRRSNVVCYRPASIPSVVVLATYFMRITSKRPTC
jgi:hypothetical protein